MDLIDIGWRERLWFFLHFEPGGIHVQLEVLGWVLTLSASEWVPDSIILHHPDTRSVGFWFEDFEFDYYRAETDADREARRLAHIEYLRREVARGDEDPELLLELESLEAMEALWNDPYCAFDENGAPIGGCVSPVCSCRRTTYEGLPICRRA